MYIVTITETGPTIRFTRLAKRGNVSCKVDLLTFKGPLKAKLKSHLVPVISLGKISCYGPQTPK